MIRSELIRITPGDGQYFFGYYDKWQFDPTDRYELGMKSRFMDRPPAPGDAIEIGMIDRDQDHCWAGLGSTTAWCWQQGCMLQWLPSSEGEVIYNVRGDGGYESVVRDVVNGESRRIGRAIYTVHPNGREAIGLDFARVGHLRAGYGYVGIDDLNEHVDAPDDSGLWRINLEGGDSELIVTIAQLAALNPPPADTTGRHWFNHILYNTDGSRLIFLHRWETKPHGWLGRMYTCKPDGSELHRVCDATDRGSFNPSHFWWRDAKTTIVWGVMPGTMNDGAYLLVEDQTGEVVELDRAQLHCDGHMSYRPDGSEWILSDTYPDKQNRRTLFLYHADDNRRIDLAQLGAGNLYGIGRTSECRCDLHPRWSRDDAHVCIDSVHEGCRAMYLLDVSAY